MATITMTKTLTTRLKVTKTTTKTVCTLVPFPKSQVLDSSVTDPFIKNWMNLLCFLLSGMPADGTIAAEVRQGGPACAACNHQLAINCSFLLSGMPAGGAIAAEVRQGGPPYGHVQSRCNILVLLCDRLVIIYLKQRGVHTAGKPVFGVAPLIPFWVALPCGRHITCAHTHTRLTPCPFTLPSLCNCETRTVALITLCILVMPRVLWLVASMAPMLPNRSEFEFQPTIPKANLTHAGRGPSLAIPPWPSPFSFLKQVAFMFNECECQPSAYFAVKQPAHHTGGYGSQTCSIGLGRMIPGLRGFRHIHAKLPSLKHKPCAIIAPLCSCVTCKVQPHKAAAPGPYNDLQSRTPPPSAHPPSPLPPAHQEHPIPLPPPLPPPVRLLESSADRSALLARVKPASATPIIHLVFAQTLLSPLLPPFPACPQLVPLPHAPPILLPPSTLHPAAPTLTCSQGTALIASWTSQWAAAKPWWLH